MVNATLIQLAGTDFQRTLIREELFIVRSETTANRWFFPMRGHYLFLHCMVTSTFPRHTFYRTFFPAFESVINLARRIRVLIFLSFSFFYDTSTRLEIMLSLQCEKCHMQWIRNGANFVTRFTDSSCSWQVTVSFLATSGGRLSSYVNRACLLMDKCVINVEKVYSCPSIFTARWF